MPASGYTFAMPKPNIIGTREAAEILGLTHHHLKRLARDGQIPATKIGNTWLFIRADVERIKAERGKKS